MEKYLRYLEPWLSILLGAFLSLILASARTGLDSIPFVVHSRTVGLNRGKKIGFRNFFYPARGVFFLFCLKERFFKYHYIKGTNTYDWEIETHFGKKHFV